MTEKFKHQVFGIRHHGPGSARSLKLALEALKPDCLLVEGPPEANELIPLVLDAGMNPPVALLIYAETEPQRAVYYPFVRYSPEWQALCFGASQGITTRFFDLPLSHRLVEQSPLESSELEFDGVDSHYQPSLEQDPLFYLAQAAGYSDSERWWEQLVEERLSSEGVFEAILEAMTALRQEVKEASAHEERREAFMRSEIRRALAEGFERIAVVCGAWHSPALQDLSGLKQDKATLAKLPKSKVKATWIPYTSGRLARASGYGAGIRSPGWYDHVWQYSDNALAGRWLAKVAGLLREEGIDASSAQVIEGVRLAEALAALRGRASIGLDELNEAAYALFAGGNELILELIAERLIVASELGSVTERAPATPLQLDLEKAQKSLRMAPQALEKSLELDLRKDNDLARSQLLHRLRLLDIPWGEVLPSSGKGTFKELWQLCWHPEFVLRLIEAGYYGQTIEQASSSKVKELAQGATNLAYLSQLLDDSLLANIPEASQELVAMIQLKAAQDPDLSHLVSAFPRLTHVLRYGNVRLSKDADLSTLEHVVKGLLARICVALPAAASSLNEEAASKLFSDIQNLHASVKLLEEAERADWLATLEQLASSNLVHALIKGRSVKLLLDEGQLEPAEAARQLGIALSDPEIEKAAYWLEGLLKDAGLLVAHDDELFTVLDSWFASLSPEAFVRVLPLVRRTFSTFESPERQAIGQKAKGVKGTKSQQSLSLNEVRGEKMLEHLALLLGTKGEGV
ncbi:MAG: hypothetical protein KC422_09485 [Trueperaceae bacterium]|nr:hypothetical protein [Trueperaceae bacterium]